jgi:hypothetical protein
MKWSQFTIAAERTDGTVKTRKTRAVSVAHAMTKCQREFPALHGYTRHEVELCRCSEINNDMCTACYLFWGLQ